jgi:hypothetical protein
MYLLLFVVVTVPILGEALNGDKLGMPETAAEVRAQGVFSKIKTTFQLVGIVPCPLAYRFFIFHISYIRRSKGFMRHRPAQHLAQAEELIKILKTEQGIKTLGAVGYVAAHCRR